MSSNPMSSWSVYSPRSSGQADQSADSPERQIGKRITPRPDGCWVFNGKTNKYGQINVGGQRVTVHRWVYERLVGPIDEGCHLHHTCVTPGCCNPAHLVPLTPKEHAAAHRQLRETR